MPLQTIKKLNLNLFQAHNSIQCDCRYYIALQWHFSDRKLYCVFCIDLLTFSSSKKATEKEENVEHDH